MSDFPQADESFDSVAHFFIEDVKSRRFHYHLLRLRSMAGLTDQDVEELGELGRLVFQNGQAEDQAAKIKNRPDASGLAVTLASIVYRMAPDATSAPAPDLKRVLMGALTGAYLSTGGIPNHDGPTLACLGAIAGAVTVALGAFTMDAISQVPLDDYVRTQD
ncbi:hypothetical protein ACH47Z_38605 [Streptomyces sp. NPDC020192]|uniref:hypothetical protein n=1 Tax=Streptomyces sp. NPDC020192 TaxID=3365066 RepID=UPI0037ACD009